jgi:tRNA threonylcarbamoyladenosine biosynthesis protein TsaE
MSSESLQLTTHDDRQTEALGQVLGRLLQPGDVVALTGPLGAGKTCLTRGIARGLGIEEPVTSPTFILVGEYETAAGFFLYHADCYRLQDPVAEAIDIGLEELLYGGGICVVEWAERIQELLPPDCLRVTLRAAGLQTRALTLTAGGPRSLTLLAALGAALEPLASPA